MIQVDLKIVARQNAGKEPWLWKLAKEFNVKFILVKANIEEDFGWAQISLEGPVEEVQRATAWLMTTGMHVEALQRSLREAV